VKIEQMKPSINSREKKAVFQYMHSDGWLTEHKVTRELEKKIAKYVGTKYCSMLCNGTVTLYTALMIHGVKPGDTVVVPDYTMIATANAVTATGAKPVFVDVERDTLCMDIVDERILSKAKALMLVSINGRYPHVLPDILESCHHYGVSVIEDAAQSLGSFHYNKHVGTYGEIGSFSFSMPKIISAGNGGCLVTNDKKIYDKVNMFKNFGRKKSGVDKSVCFGLNFKYNDILATILIEQMKKLDWRVDRKREIYKLYRDLLDGTPGIEFIDTDLSQTTPWMNDILVKNRSKVIPELIKRGIGCRPFYPALHTQAPYKSVKGTFQNSTWISNRGLWLPSAVSLSDEEVEYTCRCVRSVMK